MSYVKLTKSVKAQLVHQIAKSVFGDTAKFEKLEKEVQAFFDSRISPEILELKALNLVNKTTAICFPIATYPIAITYPTLRFNIYSGITPPSDKRRRYNGRGIYVGSGLLVNEGLMEDIVNSLTDPNADLNCTYEPGVFHYLRKTLGPIAAQFLEQTNYHREIRDLVEGSTSFTKLREQLPWHKDAFDKVEESNSRGSYSPPTTTSDSAARSTYYAKSNLSQLENALSAIPSK